MAWGLRRIGESVPRPRPCGVGPRVSRRIGTSSEASWYGSGLSPLRVSPDICSRWAGRSSRASDEVAGLPAVVFWFCYLQDLSNFFGSYLGYPFYGTRQIAAFGKCTVYENRVSITIGSNLGSYSSRCTIPVSKRGKINFLCYQKKRKRR